MLKTKAELKAMSESEFKAHREMVRNMVCNQVQVMHGDHPRLEHVLAKLFQLRNELIGVEQELGRRQLARRCEEVRNEEQS